jgi:ribosomal-protein-alanine N-acetyltransferase
MPEPLISRRTPRLLLRPLVEGDRAQFVEVHALSRREFDTWGPKRPAGQTDDQLFDLLLARTENGLANGSDCRLAGFTHDGLLVGFFNLNNVIRGVFQNAFAGWSVRTDQTGRGYGAEGVAGLLDVAFLPPPLGLGLHRVQANVIPANAASLRVAAKCGFRREGLALRYLEINGTWQDHVMLAKTVEEHGGRAR